MLCVCALINPFPAPRRKISMKIPHATAKPVRAVRSLFRFDVAHNSKNKSRIFFLRLHQLFHYSIDAKRTGCVVKVLFNLANDAIFNMDNLVGFVGNTALVRHDNNGFMLFFIKLFK